MAGCGPGCAARNPQAEGLAPQMVVAEMVVAEVVVAWIMVSRHRDYDSGTPSFLASVPCTFGASVLDHIVSGLRLRCEVLSDLFSTAGLHYR